MAITDERGGARGVHLHTASLPRSLSAKSPLENPTTDAFSGSATNPKMGRGLIYNIDLSIYVENRLTDFIG